MAFLKKNKAILGVVVLILVLAITFIFIQLDLAAQLRIGVGWKAQILCSGVFVSGRVAAPVLEEDVAVHPILRFIRAKVDYEKKEVRASFLGLIKNRSIFHMLFTKPDMAAYAVRLGMMTKGEWGFGEFLENILKAIKE